MKKLKLFVVKISNFINFVLNTFLIKIIQFRRRDFNENQLLLIRLDSIGDYILVQNFFNLLKVKSPYKEYKITLCGNVIWKDLAEHCNKKIFDNFIWINKKKFKWNIPYKYKILKSIYHSGFSVAVETTFSREILFGDTIIKASKATTRIGSTGSPDNHLKWKRKIFSDDYYTKLITQIDENLFEFYRNREFFEKLLKTKIDLEKPTLNFEDVLLNFSLPENYIVIVPGAQEKARRWSEKNFSELIKYLLKEYHYNILLAGSSSEKAIIKQIISGIESERVFDLSGKTTLTQYGKIISKAKLLISNETSGVHFAAAVNTPFICISNGKHIGRFNPYPIEMNLNYRYIYPRLIEKMIDNNKIYSERFCIQTETDINEISVERVKNAISELIER